MCQKDVFFKIYMKGKIFMYACCAPSKYRVAKKKKNLNSRSSKKRTTWTCRSIRGKTLVRQSSVVAVARFGRSGRRPVTARAVSGASFSCEPPHSDAIFFCFLSYSSRHVPAVTNASVTSVAPFPRGSPLLGPWQQARTQCRTHLLCFYFFLLFTAIISISQRLRPFPLFVVLSTYSTTYSFVRSEGHALSNLFVFLLVYDVFSLRVFCTHRLPLRIQLFPTD